MTERSVLFSGREWVCTSREGLVWHWRRADGSVVGAIYRAAFPSVWRVALTSDLVEITFHSLDDAARCMERYQ